MKAILAGLKKRHEETGDVPVLIHTVRPFSSAHDGSLQPLMRISQSGAVIVTDDARGEFASPDIKSDLDIAMIDAIPRTVIHHAVDLLVTNADAEGYVRASIVVPSQVYGTASGPLFDAGISKRTSIALPLLAEAFAKRGRAGIVGAGKTVWQHVHWEDSTSLCSSSPTLQAAADIGTHSGRCRRLLLPFLKMANKPCRPRTRSRGILFCRK